MSTMKIYAMDDETWYSAESIQEATRLYMDSMGDGHEFDDGYPRELTDAEYDKEIPDFDEDERPTGQMTTPRAWLADAQPGFLAGTNW
jgi:hypothetical protein